MSPEQAAGAPVDHRTDIYALGVMLYEMVSGQLPFNADNFMGILTQHMYKAPVPIRALVPGPECPPSLEAVILKCLSKRADLRYQSMEELAADLQRAKDGGVPEAVNEMMGRSGGFNVPQDYFKQGNAIVPATPPEEPKRWSRVAVGAGAVAAVGIVTAGLVVGNIVHSRPPPKQPETTAVTAPLPPPPPSPPPSAEPQPPPPPKKVSVVIAATPKGAMGYRDDKPFPLPSSVEVEEGQKVNIEIRADGYETLKLELDGKELSKQVELTKVPKPTKPKGPRGNEPPPTNPDIKNPWPDDKPPRR
jgi:serine/threonine-protein kinase